MALAHFPPPNRLARDSHLKVCSWNIQGGIRDRQENADVLMEDLAKKSIDIAVLQETHTQSRTFSSEKGTLTCVAGKYGHGFYFSNRLTPNFYGIEKISDRISTIHFILSFNPTRARTTKMTVINVYAPTSQLAQKKPEQLDVFYEDLRRTYNECRRRSAIVLICGDLNAKLGKKMDEETFIGSHSYGLRNTNGNHLARYMASENLIATNTCFQHKIPHTVTRHGNINGRKNSSQIDYILLSNQQTRLLVQSRVYRGHIFPSDHHLVVTTLNLHNYYKQLPSSPLKWKADVAQLASDVELQQRFAHGIVEYLVDTQQEDQDANVLYQNLCNAIKTSARRYIPEKITPKNGNQLIRRDPLLKELYKKRRNLTEKIRRNTSRKLLLQRKRAHVRKQIKARIKKHWNYYYATLAAQINTFPSANGQRAFEAARALKPLRYAPFTLVDHTGISCSHTPSLESMVTTFYKSFYNQPGKQAASPWIGQERPLQSPISTAEVSEALCSLKNGRAAGPDEIVGEYLKYGGPIIASKLAQIFNLVFEQHRSLPELLDGTLIPINKPKKSKVVENTRPITLLNTVRKVLSIIVLRKARTALENYVSINQSGFRRNRSTTDVVWTYRWFIARVQKYQEEMHIMGIDLSKAFDCIDRTKLMEILTTILPEDQLRIISYLLSETTLTPRIQRTMGSQFSTSIGTPQGDGLSPILFITYLEGAMRSFRALPLGIPPYEETSYADDQDFISLSREDLNALQAQLPAHLDTWNLKMNPDKTEHICLSQPNIPSLQTKKLGSKLQDAADITSRINAADEAMRTLYKIWNSRKIITLETKIAMYRSFIIPVLTYNMAASGALDSKMDQLEVTQRRHLRKILGIFYPNRISNLELYDRCKCSLLKPSIIQGRWKLFGHLLRQPQDTPANKAMIAYFTGTAQKRPGGRPSSLPRLLNSDAALVHRNLTTIEHLQHLRIIAAHRRAWKRLTAIIVSRRTRQYRNKLERANTVTSDQRSHLMITIPRSLWGQPDGQDGFTRRRRLRLILPSRAAVGGAEPNVPLKEFYEIVYATLIFYRYIILMLVIVVVACFFTLLLF
jgi:exonuclease III